MEDNIMSTARLFHESDCNLDYLAGKTVAIIGYGSQGHAHALNLKESGVHVIVGLYEGSKSWKRQRIRDLRFSQRQRLQKSRYHHVPHQ